MMCIPPYLEPIRQSLRRIIAIEQSSSNYADQFSVSLNLPSNRHGKTIGLIETTILQQRNF